MEEVEVVEEAGVAQDQGRVEDLGVAEEAEGVGRVADRRSVLEVVLGAVLGAVLDSLFRQGQAVRGLLFLFLQEVLVPVFRRVQVPQYCQASARVWRRQSRWAQSVRQDQKKLRRLVVLRSEPLASRREDRASSTLVSL